MASEQAIKAAFEHAVEAAGNYDGTVATFGPMLVAVEDYAKLAGLNYNEAEHAVSTEVGRKVCRLQQRNKQ